MMPSSWHGKTLQGDPIYIRYRHGVFKIRIGALPLDQAEPHTKIEFNWDKTDHPGIIDEDEMKHVLKMYLNFNHLEHV